MEATGRLTAAEGKPERNYMRFGPHNMRIGFRHWRRSRPFWGGVWSILGGLMIMYGPLTAYRFMLVAGNTVWMGILVGLLIAVFGIFLWFAPPLRQIVGVLITILAVVSFITSDFGGFFIGMLMAMIGGSLGFSWMPMPEKVRKHRIRTLLARRRSAEPAVTAPAPLTPVVTFKVDGRETRAELREVEVDGETVNAGATAAQSPVDGDVVRA